MEQTVQQTTITVSTKLWKELNDMKTNPKDSFESIIWKLLKGEKTLKRKSY